MLVAHLTRLFRQAAESLGLFPRRFAPLEALAGRIATQLGLLAPALAAYAPIFGLSPIAFGPLAVGLRTLTATVRRMPLVLWPRGPICHHSTAFLHDRPEL